MGSLLSRGALQGSAELALPHLYSPQPPSDKGTWRRGRPARGPGPAQVAASGCTIRTRCSAAQRGSHARPQSHSSGFPLRFLWEAGPDTRRTVRQVWGTRPGLEEGSRPASPWGGQGPTTRTASHHPCSSQPGPGWGAPAGKPTVPQGPVSHAQRPRAQPLTPATRRAAYISLKLNKLANVLSSNVEILLLLMSLEERGDLVRSEQRPHNRDADTQPPPAHPEGSYSHAGQDTHSSVSAERFARSPTSRARSRLWETSLGSKSVTGQCWSPGWGTKPTPGLSQKLPSTPNCGLPHLSSLFPGQDGESE